MMKSTPTVPLVWLLALMVLAGLGLMSTAEAALPTPTQPILIVQDAGAADRYQYFVPELLTTEGINSFQIAQLSELTSAFLARYDTVVLPHLPLSPTQATLFQAYVNAGGSLIGFRPDAQLASVFGVTPLNAILPEAWVQINPGTAHGYGLTGQTLRFHGVADRYAVNGASVIATLYQTFTTPTASPAVTVNAFGQGQATLFAFDLAQSIVLLRQGNPAWTGYPNTHDGFSTMRASQMFMDVGTSAFWNDLSDHALADVPQADEQLRLLSKSIVLAGAAKQRPLPRFWYFPDQARALLLLTGDQHSESEQLSINEIAEIQSAGGAFTNFLWYPFGSTSSSTVAKWLSDGHALGIHFDDTSEGDGGSNGSHVTWAGMESVLTQAMSAFAAAYPTAPLPVTTRNHYLIWLSTDASGAPDPIAQAKLFANAGIQLDTSFSTFPNSWGYMTGSGLPMRFLDTTTGAVVPVYEQATQYEDDVQLSNISYSTGWDFATAQAHYERSLNDSLTKYNTVVTMLFHPDSWANYRAVGIKVPQYARDHGIPSPNAAQWLSFWKSRAATAISGFSSADNTLSFTAAGAPAGLTLLVPETSGATSVATITVDGAAQTFAVEAYQGLRYATLTLSAGNHSVVVTYRASGSTARIFGRISPLAAASGTTVRIQGAGVDQSLAVQSDGSYATDPLPAGTYTLTASSAGHVFTPATRTVTVGSASASGVDFTGELVAGGDQTLFTTQVPALTNLSDGPTTNYELGTALTSDTTGTIKAIAFWKAGNETGLHTGKIWSTAGQLLASVNFTNESASGWQEQALDTPLTIDANTTYIVSVNTGNSYYVATNQGLASPVVNEHLRSVVGNNGVFGPAGQFPTSSHQSTNYFRDVVFSPAPPPPATGQTIFTTQTPALLNQSDGPTTNYELGTVFTSGVAGEVAALRFWKAANETGGHVGRVWTLNGGLLASVTFENETASGWQQQNLTTALPIAANTPYVVTVNTGATYYVATVQGLASPVTNLDLTTIAGNNGVFGPPGVFPTNSYQNTNYFRDVVFKPAPRPPAGGERIFTNETPVVASATDGPGVNYELGTAFTSAAPGKITALRFWKTANEGSTHTGRLWTAAGQLLASVEFTNETASGWQEQALPAPLPIAAGTPYVASVTTSNAYYVATNQGLATAVGSFDLKTVVGNNGLYGAPGVFPTTSYQNSNYFRDVVFVRD